MRNLVVVMVALALAGCAAPQPKAAQTPPPGAPVVEKPRPATPGDWWQARLSPSRPFQCTGLEEYVGVRDGLHVVRCMAEGYLQHFSEQYDFNYVKMTDEAGRVLEEWRPYWPGKSYPLWVGKEWRGRFDGFRAPSDRWSSDVRVKVTGLEDVEVPAGKFKAYRIELTDYWSAGGGVSGVFRGTYWYAPETVTFVKGVTSDPKWDFELVGYQYRPQ